MSAGITDWEAYFRGTPSTKKSASRRLGAADYYVDGEHYVIKMDVPGMKIDDLKISIIDSKQITIEGVKHCENNDGDEIQYLSYERAYGSFARVFKILDNVPCDVSSITAELVDGVLTVSIPVSDYDPPKKFDIPITYGCQSNITLMTECANNELNETAAEDSDKGDRGDRGLRRSSRVKCTRSYSLN